MTELEQISFVLILEEENNIWTCKLQKKKGTKKFPSQEIFSFSNYQEKINDKNNYLIAPDAFSFAKALSTHFEQALETDRNILELLFADYQMAGHFSNAFQGNPPYDLKGLLTASSFFQGLFLFLSDNDRYIRYNAWIARLFACWQWYNACKRVASLDSRNEAIQNEFSLAYRSMTFILQDRTFVPALRFLAIKQLGISTPESVAYMRLRLLLSLILVGVESRQDGKTFDITKAFRAPGLSGDYSPQWGEVELHPYFQTTGHGAPEVRRLIRNWLLPFYDIESAFQMAKLLKRSPGPYNKKSIQPNWKMPLLLGIFILLTFGLSYPYTPHSAIYPTAASFIEWMGLIGIGTIAFFSFDTGSLPHLALPRVLGGIVIGYLALIIQPAEYIKYLCEGNGLGIFPVWLLIILLWLFIMGLSLVYVWADAHYVTEARVKTAFITAINVFVYSIMATLFIGLLILPLVGDPCFTEYEIAYFGLESGVAALSNGYIIGPFGLVSGLTWLAFAPVALFAGLITQFIWERDPITASIWSPGEN